MFLYELNCCGIESRCCHVKRTAAVPNTAGQGIAPNNKRVVFKNCVPFTYCIREIKNIQADNAHDIDVVMPMYNLTEYVHIYSKTSGSLW